MTVTGIMPLSKSRVKIEIDGEFAFVLYKGELTVYSIKEGEDIDENNYTELMEKVLPKRVKLRAMNLLKNRSYTTAQLTDKLILGGYSSALIKQAIDYVASFGYINDEQYAIDFIEYNKDKKSRKKIQMDLFQKGISDQIFLAAWDEVVGDDNKLLEREQIIHWIEKKHFVAQGASYEEKQKMMAFLYRKGFSIDSIRNLLLLDITSI